MEKEEMVVKIGTFIDDHSPSVQELREELHRNAESGLDLPVTQQIIRREMNWLNLTEMTALVPLKDADDQRDATVAVAYHYGNWATPLIICEASMDAVAVQDYKINVPYQSENYGACHACGHDVIVAAQIWAAKALAYTFNSTGQKQDRFFNGSILFVFRADEEATETAGIGTAPFVVRGLRRELGIKSVDATLQIHAGPMHPFGTARIVPGRFNSALDDWVVTFSGGGGHVAFPTTPNPTLTAGWLLDCMAQDWGHDNTGEHYVNREDGAVMIPTWIGSSGEPSNNSVTTETRIYGTTRINSENWVCLRSDSRDWLRYNSQEADQAFSHQCECTVDLIEGPDPVYNNPELCKAFERVSQQNGVEVVSTDPVGAANDLSVYQELGPVALMLLGSCPPDLFGTDQQPQIHGGNFDVDPRLTPLMAKMLAQWVVEIVSN